LSGRIHLLPPNSKSRPPPNFAFGVFARAASTNGTLGDISTVIGATGSLKLSLASNG
jgi:hypothetical protein